jgi:hypothetical protein
MREHRRGVCHQQHGGAEGGHRAITRTFKKKAAAKSWATDLESKLPKGEHADSEVERRTVELRFIRF